MAHEFEVGCSLDYWVHRPATLVFNIQAAQFARQVVVDEALTFTPASSVECVTMASGNRFVRAHAERGWLRAEYRATVRLDLLVTDPVHVHEVPVERLPLEVLTYLNPSRYCQSDRLSVFAQRVFGWRAPGHHRVGAICNWVCDSVEYSSGSSDGMTSATDTLLERHGVCRDFAHLAIALCRALGIPARYVSAYAWRLHPPDFHAVFEAWLEGPEGGGWYLFDPTRKSAADGVVRIGVGMDAGEVAFCNIFGVVDGEVPRVWIRGPEGVSEVTTMAVTTV